MMKKNSWDTIALYVWIIVLVVWILVFVWIRFLDSWITFVEPPRLSDEYIREQDQKCKAMRESLDFLSEDCAWNEIGMFKNFKKDCFKKNILKEIFYSPKLHECVVAFVYDERYITRWIETEKIINEYAYKWMMDKCSFYKDWKIIEEYNEPIHGPQCIDDLEFMWEYVLGELKKQ